jgi:negative regulator of sigma E activity
MTPNDPNPNTAGPVRDPAVDRILDHNRVQLSALVDGELQPEQARFLLRRLEHDEDLRGCWERWQLAGDVMRGLESVILPSGFADRVAVAVAAESSTAQAGARHPRWARWGGGAALAASVAVIAMFLVRQSPDASTPTAPAPTTVAISKPAPVQPAVPASPASGVPDRAAQLATAVAVADAPRKVLARRSRGQSQRAALRAGTRATAEAPISVAANSAPTANATAVDPFSGQTVSLPDRPWPRAMLPGSSASGAFTVDYGNRVGNDATLHPFYPFVPRAGAPAPADQADPDVPPPR